MDHNPLAGKFIHTGRNFDFPILQDPILQDPWVNIEITFWAKNATLAHFEALKQPTGRILNFEKNI